MPPQRQPPRLAAHSYTHGSSVRNGIAPDGLIIPAGGAIVLFAVSFWSHTLNAIIIAVGLLLVLTILIQRGKGGGLIGAFGGAGGSSPFGSKAGDTFTRVTITMAGVWVLLIMIHVRVAKLDMGSGADAPASLVKKS